MPPRRAGVGPISAPARAAASSDDAVLGFIPADPADPRLTVAGAVCGADGRIDIEAYEDIMQSWASEPPPENHPDPAHPGVRAGEEVPRGLRMWDDVRTGSTSRGKANYGKNGTYGAGWVAAKSRNGKDAEVNKRFNIRTCGSWRLAFLLARLQRALWEGEDVPPPKPRLLPGSPMRLWGKGTPKRRLLRQRSSEEDSSEKAAKRLRRQTSTEQREAAKAWPKAQNPADPSAGTSGSKLNSVLERIRARVQKSSEEA